MSESYRPANGTEGEMFMRDFCYECTAESHCPIIPLTMMLSEDDEDYPEEWIISGNGMPHCTAFERK